MAAILDTITYMYKTKYKKLYKIWTHKLYNLKSIVNSFLVLVMPIG